MELKFAFIAICDGFWCIVQMSDVFVLRTEKEISGEQEHNKYGYGWNLGSGTVVDL